MLLLWTMAHGTAICYQDDSFSCQTSSRTLGLGSRGGKGTEQHFWRWQIFKRVHVQCWSSTGKNSRTRVFCFELKGSSCTNPQKFNPQCQGVLFWCGPQRSTSIREVSMNSNSSHQDFPPIASVANMQNIQQHRRMSCQHQIAQAAHS